MSNRKKITLERFVDNISKNKINKFCNMLESSEIVLSDNIFKIKRDLGLDSKEEKYFLQLLSAFKNKDDLILLINFLTEIKNTKKELQDNTSLVWSSPIKYHEKVDQTYSIFLSMINEATNSIIFVGYAMIDDENQEIFEALKRAAKERDVKIKIIFDKATKAKKWGKWTKSPKNIISKAWGSIEYFPKIYSYDDMTSSLHAKFLIIDGEKIFVTSANMTERAMTRNLELGITHKGKIAKDALELIELLISKKIISEIDYD